jgi:O-antigen ligase
MIKKFTSSTEDKFFSLFFIFALTSALFYTGNNTWLFASSFIFLILSFAVILKQRFFHSITIPVNGIFISAVLLLTWFGISIFPSQIKYLSLYNFFWVGSLVIVFLLFSFNDNKEQAWRQVWPAILLLVVIWALYGLVQHYYLRVPANASFLNRNSLAALINLALIPASGYFLLQPSNRPVNYLSDKILTLALVILFLTIFIITSRGASLSLFIGYAILIALLFKHVERQRIYSLLTIVLVSFLVSYLSQYFFQGITSNNFAERMVTLQDTSKAGNTRFIIWESLLPLFKEMPWHGFGLGSLWVFWPPHRPASDNSAGYFAHNDYMQITLEAGYPGIILLFALFIFILITFIKTIKGSSERNTLTLLQRTELVSLFAALATFAAHSFFTYNFYILPLLLITGFYLARFNQLCNLNTSRIIRIPEIKNYFKPVMYIISSTGLIFILAGYFVTTSLSSYYNKEAKALMLQHKYQESNTYFVKAQKLAPLMDNPFFSHADLLRRAAKNLINVNKYKQADSLLSLAHVKLDKAEKLHPLRPQTHHIRGLIYEQAQTDKAIIEYQKALKLDPRFLFSRIRLATLLHQDNQLKNAIQVLYEGVDYTYPVSKIMIEYMTLFAKYSREAGVESFARHLEENIKKYQNNQKFTK